MSSPGPTHLFQGVRLTIAPGVGGVAYGVNDAVAGGVANHDGAESAGYRLCMSESEAASLLKIGGSGGFTNNLASVSAKASLLRTVDMRAEDVLMLVYAATYYTESATNPSLRDNLNFVDYKHKTVSSLPSFIAEYGDQWISEIVLGVEFCAYYRFRAQRATSQQQLASELTTAGIPLAGGALNGSLQASVNNIAQHLQVSVEANQCLRGVSGVALPDPQDYVTFASRLSTLPLNAPEILDFNTSPYRAIGLTQGPT